MVKISYAGSRDLSAAISAQFTFEMHVEPENREKLTKTLILGFQSQSRSSMLTLLKSSSPVLVMISSMSVPICNHFHARPAYSGKITPFMGMVLFSEFSPRLRGPRSPSGMKFCLGILEVSISPGLRMVPGRDGHQHGQTDGHQDRITTANTCYS